MAAPHTQEFNSDFNYGWEDFILADHDSKLKYLAVQIYQSLCGTVSTDVARATVRGWFEIELPNGDSKDYFYGVDHESVLSFNPNTITDDFIKDIKGIAENERIVIYGGNDNDDHDLAPSSGKPHPVSKFTNRFSTLKMKKDGNYWIFYDKASGNKTRFSFNIDDTEAENYVKSTTPELVDVKITDYCPFGCEFCYQGSTKKGIHAEHDKIANLAYQLQTLDVFEVALGGGEPTMHPQFRNVIKTFANFNIVPNFTTFSRSWIKDDKLIDTIRKHVGGIGVSIHNLKDLTKLKDIAEAVNGDRDNFGSFWTKGVQITGQHVLGTHPIGETLDIITGFWKAKVPILLLGFKNTNFGYDFCDHDLTGLDVALKLAIDNSKDRFYQLSVDTAVLDQHPSLVKTLGVSEALTTSPEGAFSMYVDMVKGRMAKSSYVTESEYIDFVNGRTYGDQIKEEFSKF